MTKTASTIRKVWKSAQLYIGFHRDMAGNKRKEAKVWPPKNGNATIYENPSEQEVFLELKAHEPNAQRDLQIKIRPDSVVVRRDAGPAWKGVIIGEDRVSVQVNGIWISVNHDGSIVHRMGDDQTFIEADGSVLKKTEFVDAQMSADGIELSRRTPDNVSAITNDGVVSKKRQAPVPPLEIE